MHVTVAIAFATLGWFEPAVKAAPRPGGDPGALIGWVALPLMVAAVVVIVMRRRKGGKGLRTLSFGAAVGNALLDLAAVMQPDRPVAEEIERHQRMPQADAQGEGADPPPNGPLDT